MFEGGRWGWVGQGKVVARKWRQLFLDNNKKRKKKKKTKRKFGNAEIHEEIYTFILFTKK